MRSGSWKPLPAELSEPARWLITELRSLKDDSGLSLARLQIKTNYSKSSWERWLNGKQLPPRDAVVRIAETCGGDARLLGQLWARAAELTAPAADPAAPDHVVPVAAVDETPAPPGRRWRVRNTVAVLAVIGVVGAAGTFWAMHRTAAPRAVAEPTPIVATVSLAGDHPHDGECPGFLLDRPAGQLPPPDARAPRAWATGLGGVDAERSVVAVTIEGLSARAVVLTGMRVRQVGRTARAGGASSEFFTAWGCGGAISKRTFAVDLDRPAPVAKPEPGSDADGKTLPAITFPYRVSESDPEVFEVDASTGRSDCRWYLELDWQSQGRSGVLRIDDHGQPFHTVGAAGLRSYVYDDDVRRWSATE